MNLATEQKQTHKHREETCGGQGEGGGRGMDWESGVSRCKLFHLEPINNKVLLYRTGNHDHSLGMDHDGGGEMRKRMRTHV